MTPYPAGCGTKAADSQAPDFTVQVVGGGGSDWTDKKITLHELRGRAVVILFTASWCNADVCKNTLDMLSRENKDAFVMGIGVFDRKPNIVQYVRSNSFTVPVGYDEDGSITKGYKVGMLPLTVFVDKNGRQVERVVGTFSEKKLKEAYKKFM